MYIWGLLKKFILVYYHCGCSKEYILVYRLKAKIWGDFVVKNKKQNNKCPYIKLLDSTTLIFLKKKIGRFLNFFIVILYDDWHKFRILVKNTNKINKFVDNNSY